MGQGITGWELVWSPGKCQCTKQRGRESPTCPATPGQCRNVGASLAYGKAQDNQHSHMRISSCCIIGNNRHCFEKQGVRCSEPSLGIWDPLMCSSMPVFFLFLFWVFPSSFELCCPPLHPLPIRPFLLCFHILTTHCLISCFPASSVPTTGCQVVPCILGKSSLPVWLITTCVLSSLSPSQTWRLNRT